jgi:hypothetical protein
MRRNCSTWLLSIESPVAQIDRIGGIAEIEDEDVVAWSPSIRCVIPPPADNVCDTRIALPPALMRAGEGPRGIRLCSRTGLPPATVRTPKGWLGSVTSQIS